jgi:hypothetical protein
MEALRGSKLSPFLVPRSVQAREIRTELQVIRGERLGAGGSLKISGHIVTAVAARARLWFALEKCRSAPSSHGR